MRTTPAPTTLALAALGAALTVTLLPRPAAADLDAKRYVDSFYSQSGCQQAGRKGRSEGRWRTHTCVKTMFERLGTWDLWVE